MRHGRRTTITTSDIDQALRVLNIEPLYGHSPHNQATFRRALPFPQLSSAGAVYFVEDEEIDFDRFLREDKIPLPKGVTWTAHWLAVEGVQPLIPENPPPIPRDPEPAAEPSKPLEQQRPLSIFAPTPPSPTRPSANPNAKTQQQHLVKQVLSRELQLYYTRLTSSLLPPSTEQVKRTAALASLRNDAGLQALLPYLIRWSGEGVVGVLKEGSQGEHDGQVLEVLLDVIGAILDNNTLFVEPYVCPSLVVPFQWLTNFANFTPASSTPSTHPFDAPPLHPARLPLYPPPHLRLPNALSPTHAVLDYVPVTLAADNEDAPACAYISGEE
jgi:transcription initiation factor TFIID subunit 6